MLAINGGSFCFTVPVYVESFLGKEIWGVEVLNRGYPAEYTVKGRLRICERTVPYGNLMQFSLGLKVSST